MDRLRTPFLLIAIALSALVVMIELGSTAVLGTVQVTDQALASQLSGELREEYEDFDDDQRAELQQLRSQGGPPGLGIPALALIDGSLLYILALIGAGLAVPERVLGRVQGLLTLVLSFLLVLGSIIWALSTLALLLVMVGLLLAVPFGTIVYMARFGFFDTGGAAATLSLMMTLKLASAVLLVVAHQRFLQNRGLVTLVVVSLLANIILMFLQAFPPGFLVSITDAVGAIVFAIVGAIFGIILLLCSLVSVIKAVRIDRGLA